MKNVEKSAKISINNLDSIQNLTATESQQVYGGKGTNQIEFRFVIGADTLLKGAGSNLRGRPNPQG